ncbi:MAG TPA: poly(A) polymerase, partial [Thermoanaerobaculia bacterium]|nr:poly(A) polymerase [Thermoanaerobaculia bacterium]
LVDLARREGETLFDPPRLVTGADVQELLGIPPGREIGRVLDAVRAAQVEGRVRTREEAVEMVRGWGGPTPRM